MTEFLDPKRGELKLPYIKQVKRKVINKQLFGILENITEGHFVLGDLAYMITKMLLAFYHNNMCYATGAALAGMLSDTRQEFYRKVMVPLEDKKIQENGDVFNED